MKRVFKSEPLDVAVDVRRNDFHANIVQPEFLGNLLTPQSYRPEILAAREELQERTATVPLDSMCSQKVRQGVTPVYGDGGPPCLKIKNVRSIMVDANSTETVSESFAKSNKDSVASDGIVLIARKGAFCAGRTAVYLDNDEKFVSDDVFICKVVNPHDPAFVACYLNTWWGKRSLESGITGSTGQLNLSQSHVGQLPIPDVEPTVQRGIGNLVRKANRLRQLLEAAITEIHLDMDALLSGLMTEKGLDEEQEALEKWLNDNPPPPNHH